jgi:hypothetical protein
VVFVTSKVPVRQPLCTVALRLGPRRAVRERAEVSVHEDDADEEATGDLQPHARPERARCEIEYGAPEQDGEVEGREVVVQEELAAHEEEGRVVQRPSSEQEATQRIILDDLGCTRHQSR